MVFNAAAAAVQKIRGRGVRTPLAAMPAPHPFYGYYGCAGGNLYAGTLDIHGKPNGKGVLYYLESGECDVGTFSPDMKQTGIGVRFNRERDKAFGLENGVLQEQIHVMTKALERAGLDQPPVERHKGLIPSAFGYNKTRTEQVKAWYKYRSLANLSMTESCYGVNEYLPDSIRGK
ncbi:unnamed protein product [Durusdinium trenchii]|uniref:Uncharacterized protein n=2 Tax=Durusdinium trenchii TaxID=1381693 RepID=A0ABP0PUN1_9DINO